MASHPILSPKAVLLHADVPVVTARSGQKFVVESLDAIKENIRQMADEHVRFGIVKIPQIQTDIGVSLAAYQTPIRNQQDRGTCWGFAGVAAMEAAYKRTYGLNLDLSEQYLIHLEKCSELYTDYVTNTTPHENNSSFWDNQGNSGILGTAQRMAVCEEKFAPYMNHGQMNSLRVSLPAAGNLDWNSTQEQLDAFEYNEKNIPRDARFNAIYAVTSWQAVGSNPSTSDLEKVIAAKHEVVVDLDLKWKWDATKSAYDYDADPANKSAGGHTTLVIGYDQTKQIFIIKNSWGGSDYLHVTYNFMQHCCLYGTYITGVSDPKTAAQVKAMWIGNWNMDHDGWRGSLTIRRFTNFHDNNATAPTKLGDYYRDGKRHDVNGYFSGDGREMVFYIADGTNKIQPGTETGQQFTVYVFSWDHPDAAGRTTWQNRPFGALLKRDAVPSFGSKTFQENDWIGSYAMNHDGWRGTLTISSVAPHVNASYKDSQGKVLPVTATLNAAAPNALTLFIKFSNENNQRFDLLHHTWEKGVFSGTTVWAAQTFGVQGFHTLLIPLHATATVADPIAHQVLKG